ncbi:aldo/keto reductase [Bosea sp. (in: a-proteobacteria)]|uniref:aldo/keto reductase n=1 Tax=Bosea sp. (in: a-proteobacteria) TaxID=1871050 RepID=UPI002629ADE0|nr:aldo/keto reductase [Bosea sp. (in: a-proteobacteria)]MCO5090378.1 aldo/keto reductase [Bosea sp. (in: a-proteobacteria)]
MKILDAHGARIPAIGFGTGSLPGQACIEAVGQALKAGYRHLDCAASYGNEAQVGQAIKASGLPREELFLTTKVWPGQFREADMIKAAEASLKALGVDRVDLFLLHWPDPAVALPDTIRALNGIARRGLTRHIGVSNFTTALLAQAWAATEAPLVANQCEYHPGLDQSAVIAACRGRGMAFVSYMPLGRCEVLALPLLGEIGRRVGKSPAQVALRWLLQQDGVAAIPKSTDPQRMRENLALFDFVLSPEDMAAISALARPDGRMIPFPRARRPDGSVQEFRDLAPVWD